MSQLTVVVAEANLTSMLAWLDHWNTNADGPAGRITFIRPNVKPASLTGGSERHTLVLTFAERNLAALNNWLAMWNSHRPLSERAEISLA